MSGITIALTVIFRPGFRSLPRYLPQMLSIKASLSTEHQSSRSILDQFHSLKETNAVNQLTVLFSKKVSFQSFICSPRNGAELYVDLCVNYEAGVLAIAQDVIGMHRLN